jgi:hypothetical protein
VGGIDFGKGLPPALASVLSYSDHILLNIISFVVSRCMSTFTHLVQVIVAVVVGWEITLLALRVLEERS